MQFHHTVLDNGLRVIAEVNDQAHSVASGFFVKAGSRDESTEVAGVSHFLEHMVFKGTPRRDALAVNRDFDRVGAKHNAQTSEEDTFYHVTCLPEYLPQAFDVLSDILRPNLAEEDFDTEKQVIIEEIRMYLDNPMSVAYEAAKAAHFGPHPLGQSILGTIESITDLKVDQMRHYFAQRYSPSNIVLAFAGKTDWDQVVALAKAHCGGWQGGQITRQAVPPRGTGSFQAILRAEDQQQTIIGVGDAPPLESSDRYAAQLLATVLGDHTGSRLYWTLIDPGYADGVEVSYQDYNQAGALFTFLSCDPGETQANLGRISEVYRAATAEGITEEELTQAKNKVLARSVLRSERPMGRLASLGFHWTYRREYLSVAQELEAFSRVTLDDLRRILAEWPLLPMTIVSVGPTTDVHAPE
ncbi:M16 family metallopeptidase [Singulisphaera acidiphila]|uniref:Putative Zn-dependent peptidase n=1 Tax=Singulisphaera acidiphila (strain ATCC BAA-1392 / DSM 18658 / VKM B-2454 / MOB10) TaxID=886293 RepID=L0D999_SINAD|nr:pitrilysin family protein [Singulisphaera acidiphila]AGA25236.1 putative Zn-dependent peptidase [Singulisphaera acidiphila DSM 18658]